MALIKLKGTIVPNDDKLIYDWCGIEATCPNDIEQGLRDAAGEDVTIEISSGGGDVFSGSEMSYQLKKYEGNVTAEISGFCASAATIVACGADKAIAHPSALYMIHNVSCTASGDTNAFKKQAETLATCNRAIAEIYESKTGKSSEELLKLMNKETWMTASEAKENGFIDEIVGESTQPVAFTNGIAKILPEEAKARIKNQIMQEKDKQKSFSDDIEKEKLNLLRMKGELI